MLWFLKKAPQNTASPQDFLDSAIECVKSGMHMPVTGMTERTGFRRDKIFLIIIKVFAVEKKTRL